MSMTKKDFEAELKKMKQSLGDYSKLKPLKGTIDNILQDQSLDSSIQIEILKLIVYVSMMKLYIETYKN